MYKTLYGTKLLRIIFDKIHGSIRRCDSTKYLAFFILMKNMKEFLI